MTVSALITVVFTVLYFACSLLYLRGLKIGTKELCVSGLIIALMTFVIFWKEHALAVWID